MSDNKIKDFWWPEIVDEDSARKTAAKGMAVAVLCSLITAVAAIGGFAGAGIGNLLDAAIFAGVAIGIKMMSRAAAIGGLVLYVLERLYAVSQGGHMSPMVFLMIVMFINAVRATNAFHDMGFSSKSDSFVPSPRSGPPLPNGLYIPPKAH